MKSERPDTSTSVVEVARITSHGFWLLLPTGEVFVSFAAFPWFQDATVAQIQDVRLLHRDHLYWPALDVDLALESIIHPERYPLSGREGSGKPRRGSAEAGEVSEKSAV